MKHHFANSNMPLKEGSDLHAMCGATIPRAKFAALLDCAIVGYSFAVSAVGMCRKCNNIDLPKRFVYVITAGQESMVE